MAELPARKEEVEHAEEEGIVFKTLTNPTEVLGDENGWVKGCLLYTSTENDLVFITNGGCVENSTLGSQDTPAEFKPELKEGGGWDLWRKIAAQDPSFGHPDKFCYCLLYTSRCV